MSGEKIGKAASLAGMVIAAALALGYFGFSAYMCIMAGMGATAVLCGLHAAAELRETEEQLEMSRKMLAASMNKLARREGIGEGNYRVTFERIEDEKETFSDEKVCRFATDSSQRNEMSHR